MPSNAYIAGAGLGQRFDLRAANAKDVRIKVAIFGGLAVFFLLVLILPNPTFLLNAFEGHPRDSADYAVIGGVFALIAALVFIAVWSILSEVSAYLVVTESGLLLERGEKVTHSIPWSGGVHEITLGDARIPQTSTTPDTVTPVRIPPNQAWIQPGSTMINTTRLTDEAYDAILQGARERRLPIKTKVVGVATKGGVWYYLQFKIG